MLSINCRNYETSLIVLSYSYGWGCTDITMECLSNNLWAGSPSIPFNIINIPMSRSAVLQATFKSWVWCFHPTFVAFKRLGFHIPPPLRIQRCFRHGSPPHATGPQGPNDLHVRWSQPPGADGRFLEMGDLQVTMVVSLHMINNGLI